MTSHPYPTHVLPPLLQNFTRAVSASVQASEMLVGPVVLAAAAAAVQGVANVQCSGREVPTSLYFGVIAPSGARKSTVLQSVTAAFEHYESEDVQRPPLLFDDATRAGILEAIRAGAKSLFHALDEGEVMFQRLDLPGLCKSFDGTPIRVARNNSIFKARDVRTSMCLMAQGAVFDRMLGNQPLAIESGFLPRMLLSFAPPRSNVFGMVQYGSNHEQEFHDRIYALLQQQTNTAPRLLMKMSEQAQFQFDRLLSRNCVCPEMQPFDQRAAEHVLRLAAVLQYFQSSGLVVEAWALDAAFCIVAWHMDVAYHRFGPRSPEDYIREWAESIHAYLVTQRDYAGKFAVPRSELLRYGPTATRNAGRLNIALRYLEQQHLVREFKMERKAMVQLSAVMNLPF